MKQETPPTALALVTKKVEPPLTKKELLRATAIAMQKKQREAWSLASKTREKRYESLTRIATALAKKQMPSAKVVVNNVHYEKYDLEVIFTVTVERKHPDIAAAIADYQAIKLPDLEGEDAIYKRLQEASKAPERIMDMLKDDKFLKKLAEAGEKMLEKPTETDKATAISV
jgi:anion-transporting  ArsA/GET3 family ATPase